MSPVSTALGVGLCIIVAVTFVTGCDDMGFYRDARRCKQKLDENLKQSEHTLSCCPYYRLQQCLHMASRYSDCPQTFAMSQMTKYREETGLQRHHCNGGRELCAN
ncbi:uncharacterized protein LOC135397608 [Ornithodoros turicata]|uniref:uncharacterized protein LOC135397608 n=1 Tax=Ornithodoros turicata TaxID=34597 RepID=UPI00313938B3